MGIDEKRNFKTAAYVIQLINVSGVIVCLIFECIHARLCVRVHVQYVCVHACLL